MYEFSNVLTVQELIDKLSKIKDKSLRVEVSTGHIEKGGRFTGGLLEVYVDEDHNGKRVTLTGEMQG